MDKNLPGTRKSAKGGRHARPAAAPAEPAVTIPAGIDPVDLAEPVVADPWLSKLERDTDRAIRAAGDGDITQAINWLCLAVRSMAAHMPGTRQVAEEIRTRRLVVAGSDGKPRVILAGEGAELLQAFRPDGEPVMDLSVPERDWKAPVHLRIGSDRGISTTLIGGTTNGGVEVSHGNAVVAALETYEMTSPSLTLLDHSGAKITAGFEEGAELKMQDADDDARLLIDCSNGNATVGVYREGTGAELMVTGKDNAKISVWAKGGHGYELQAEAGGPVVHAGRDRGGRDRGR